MMVEGGGGLIHELERRLRVTEPVIKFLTVRVDEEQKRLDKIKAIRDARRKTPPAPPRCSDPGRRSRRRDAARQRYRATLNHSCSHQSFGSSDRVLKTDDCRRTTDLKEHHG